MWVSGAQGQLDDAVGIFRFRDRPMLTQKKKRVNSMEWTVAITIHSIVLVSATPHSYTLQYQQ